MSKKKVSTGFLISFISAALVLSAVFVFCIFQLTNPDKELQFNKIITLYWIVFFLFTLFSFFNVIFAHRAKSLMSEFLKSMRILPELKKEDIKSNNKRINEICEAYKASFLPNKVNGLDKTRSNADLYFGGTVWLEDSFKYYSLLSVLKIIPGTFTGFGILGTFLGFANGVSGIDPDNLIPGVTGLLSGLSTAFNTSIFGIVASILVNYVLIQPLLRSINGMGETLCDFLDQKFYISEVDAIMQYSLVVDEENNQIPFSDSLRMITDRLQTMDNSLESFNANLADKISNFNTTISEKLESGFESQNNSLSHLEDCFTDNFSGLGDAIKNFQKNSIEGMVDGVQQAVTQTLSQHLVNLREDVSKTSEMLEQCTSVLEKTPDLLKQSVDVLNETVNTSIEEFKKQSEESINNLTQSINENLNEHFSTYAKNLNKKMTDSIEKLTNTENSIEETFESGSRLISETNTTLIKKFEESNEAALAKVVDAIQTEITEKFDTFADRVEEASESFIDIQNSISLLPDKFNEVSNTLGNTVGVMSKSVDALGAHLASVSTASEKLEDLFEVFQKTNKMETDKFKDLVLQFQGLFDEYKEVNTECNSILKEFRRMDDSLASVYKSINDYTTKYSNTVGESLARYMNSFSDAAGSFGKDLQGTVASLSTSLEGTKEIANTLSASVDRIIKENKKLEKKDSE